MSKPFARGVDDATVMLLDFWVGQLAPKRPQRGKRPLFIRAHQTRISHHISGEDRGKTAAGGHRGHC
jgi:hypothetical protein